jgi:phosphoglycerol transferase
MAMLLRLWRADLHVPFQYEGDSVFYLVLVKAIASGEWIWSNNTLGAPFGINFAAFPQNITFTSGVMCLISILPKSRD